MKSRTLFSAILSVAVISGFATLASAASAPILVKRSLDNYGAGKVRTVECALSVDGVVIKRELDGITSTEERSYKLTGAIDTKMDDVSATKVNSKKTATSDFSYSMMAYRPGTGDVLLLSSYDGTKGEDIHNPSPGAGVLRAVLNDACGK